jgi:hypothetical protein
VCACVASLTGACGAGTVEHIWGGGGGAGCSARSSGSALLRHCNCQHTIHCSCAAWTRLWALQYPSFARVVQEARGGGGSGGGSGSGGGPAGTGPSSGGGPSASSPSSMFVARSLHLCVASAPPAVCSSPCGWHVACCATRSLLLLRTTHVGPGCSSLRASCSVTESVQHPPPHTHTHALAAGCMGSARPRIRKHNARLLEDGVRLPSRGCCAVATLPRGAVSCTCVVRSGVPRVGRSRSQGRQPYPCHGPRHRKTYRCAGLRSCGCRCVGVQVVGRA